MNKIITSVVYMFVIALFFTSLVSIIKITSEDKITKNQSVKLQKNILVVLKMDIDKVSSPIELFKLYKNRILETRVKNRDIYIGYEEDGKTIRGYAFHVNGAGFWGPIHAMIGIDSKISSIIGIAFYKHSETPGLGARISEDWFTKQFYDLSLYPRNDNKIFYLSPEKAGKASNDLDAITGASRTSDAIETFLNNELDLFLKEYRDLLNKGQI